MMSNPAEGADLVRVVESLTQVISIQAGVIDELFKTLMQHMEADEIDRLPCVERLNRAAALCKDLPY